MIQDVIDWLREDPPGRGVEFYLTSNESTVNPGASLVSYARGILTSYTSSRSFWGRLGEEEIVHNLRERITGGGGQMFNDRNFDRSQQDVIQLSVELTTPPPSSMPFHLAVELTLVTWGGGVIPLTGFHCEEGVLFAYAESDPQRSGTNKVGYTITFKKVAVP